MTREKRWKDMTTAISDAMLDEFVVSGDYSVIAATLRERFAGLASRITFPLAEETGHDAAIALVVRDLQAG